MKKVKGKGNGLMAGSDQKYLATTRHLTRILIVLKDSKQKMSKYDLYQATGIEYPKLKDALNWLINHKLISKIRDQGYTERYFV